MSFACRNCKEKFNLNKLLADSNTLSNGYSVVSTQCGHLFHKKCLEGALTNQKLLHARHGIGPLRRFCPVARCNANIPSEDSLIRISFPEEDDTAFEESAHGVEDSEGQLFKRVQTLLSEKEKLLENLERANNEAELLRSAVDEIKFDLSDIQSFLHDDNLLKKGDLIFWTTKDGTYAPGKVLEIRKKPGENVHYAIVKLDNKTKVSGVGPHSVERDTLIIPVKELMTFKTFFREFFDKFQAKFDSLLVDLNIEIQDLSSPLGSQPTDRGTAYYRSTRKLSRSVSKSCVPLDPLDELASVAVDSIPVASVRKNSQTSADIKTTKVTRSKTIHYGAGNEPRRLEKCRSMSWATPPTTNTLVSPTISESSRYSRSSQDLRSPTTEEDEDEEIHHEFIREGETVIWFDTHSNYQQLGTVASVCEYSPCAIVKFEEHPVVKHKFQYRTVPLDELFPYDLASPEDKFRIAEAYGKVSEFIETREYLFSISNEESSSGEYERSPENEMEEENEEESEDN